MKSDFELQPFWGNTLFKQGTELVALQRGNLEMANLAPQDISKQVTAWSLLTSAYLFRDVAHLKKTFKSDVGRDFIKIARDQLEIEVITPVYFGARHVNLKPDRTIRTPADLAGIKLRMPPGEFWQFLGESIGVNPTPVAFAEVYRRLADRRHRRPGQPAGPQQAHEVRRGDDAVRADRSRVGYDLLTISSKAWNTSSPSNRRAFARRPRRRSTTTPPFEGQGGTSSRPSRPTAESLHARCRRIPHLRAEKVRRQVRPRLAERRTREINALALARRDGN
jgi:hypothetical protein